MEPEAEDPPVRVGRDWVLAGLVAAATLVEVLLRDDLVWRPLALAFGLTLALAMLWRRTRPLRMVGLAFGTLLMLDLASVLAAGRPGWAVKEALSTAVKPAYLRVSDSTVIMGHRGVRSDGHRFFLREERPVRRSVAAGLGVHTHGLGRSSRSGRQMVTTTLPRVWPAPT